MAHPASWSVTIIASSFAIASWITVAPPRTIATIGGISGTVTNASGGAPLQNVGVQVYNSTGGLVSSTSTDALGVYTVSGLAAGTHFAKTSNTQGYVEQLFSGKPCTGGFCSVTTGTPITVTDGTTTQNIDFALTAGGVITGTVRSRGRQCPDSGHDAIRLHLEWQRDPWYEYNQCGRCVRAPGNAARQLLPGNVVPGV